MQPKVSIVIPCYNKVKYISGMFDSIIAQKWDNIELILVNDGSTDGTREIITEYIPKFAARGFEAVIIDQENKGLPCTVFEGLKRITGEYFCQVDADDMLDPEYVSTLTGWLAENSNYEWAACGMRYVRKDISQFIPPFPLGINEHFTMEAYILWRMEMSICIYMVRVSYLRRCGIYEHFYSENFGSQESQIALPLIAGGGKLKYINRPLYHYLQIQPDKNHHSHSANIVDALRYFRGWFLPVRETIKQLPIDENKKERLLHIADFSQMKKQLLFDSAYELESNQEISVLREALISTVNKMFSPSPMFSDVSLEEIPLLIRAVEDCILGIKATNIPQRPKGRLIAWGVLGKRGRTLLPVLKGSCLNPTDLWDIAGDNVTVMKPNPAILGSSDLVLSLPVIAIDNNNPELRNSGCAIMYSDEILANLSLIKYKKFYDGSFKFNPKGD